jgi:hypothetical protein
MDRKATRSSYSHFKPLLEAIVSIFPWLATLKGMPLYFLPKSNEREREEAERDRERQKAREEEEKKKMMMKKGQSLAIPKTKALLTKIDEDVYLSF